MKPNALKVDPRDNVATVLTDLKTGDAAFFLSDAADESLLSIIAGEGIPYGHKIALQTVRRGEAVIKYGAPIATATVDIESGMHVHLHNVRSARIGART